MLNKCNDYKCKIPLLWLITFANIQIKGHLKEFQSVKVLEFYQFTDKTYHMFVKTWEERKCNH